MTKKTSIKATGKKPKAVKPAPEIVTTLAGEKIPAAELSHIAPYLRPFAVRADSLTRDPSNARLHGEGDLPSTARTLARYGQRDLLKFDANRVIKIGNGRHECATDPAHGLKWKWVAAVAEDLPAAELKLFAIAHNRTGERADWYAAELDRQFEQFKSEIADFSLEDAGFSQIEVDALFKDVPDVRTAHGFARDPGALAESPAQSGSEGSAPSKDPKTQWKIIVDCRDEEHQRELIADFQAKGLIFNTPSM